MQNYPHLDVQLLRAVVPGGAVWLTRWLFLSKSLKAAYTSLQGGATARQQLATLCLISAQLSICFASLAVVVGT